MATLTEQFMQALRETEDRRDPTPLVELFAKDCTLRNLTTHEWSGKEGAREFWTRYLENFETIRSEFFHHADDGRTGIMEWEATGRLPGGHDIAYRGSSVIEHDGQKVGAFRTYYDSAAFVKPAAEGQEQG
ncbi:nuclear transport factor 2 family protein [Deinococcus murrayi]|uniref:nuclear transport factor 2 family protein n=1 Tax=Deinococcus murrayi TaxID=68910 RepID=UPI000556A209|nr:nuclear transport factor 2 family protein [Deinococcus murrayi]